MKLTDTGAEQLKRVGNAVKEAKTNFVSKFKKDDKRKETINAGD